MTDHDHAGHDHDHDHDHAGHDHDHDHDHAGHDHDHGHAGHAHVGRETQRRVLWLALLLNGVFLVVEVVSGLLFHSLALLADAAHMVSDVGGLVLALIAQRLVDRPTTDRYTFGLQRAEVLGAQVNGLSLLVVAAGIAYAAVQRIGDDTHVVGGGLLAVAMVGLAINAWSAVLLARAQGTSLNMRGAYLHMLLDATASFGAVLAGIAIVLWGANWVDPLVSFVIVALVVWSAWGLVRETARVFLEGVPRGLDASAVEEVLQSDPEVEAVHHLHLWNLASDVTSLSAHVVLKDEQTLHDAQAHGERLKVLLAERFGIEHATLELECHPCEPAPDERAGPARTNSRH